jgi:hypothetical protein
VTTELLDSFIEIEPLSSDEFLKVKETLTRIGLIGRPNTEDDPRPILWQSCHIFHKAGVYYIVHFKQMFLMDGRNHTQLSEEDILRTQSIAGLLEKWGLIKILPRCKKGFKENHTMFFVIPFSDKPQYKLLPKYTMGSKKFYKSNQ